MVAVSHERIMVDRAESCRPSLEEVGVHKNNDVRGTLNRNHHGGKVFPRKCVGKERRKNTQKTNIPAPTERHQRPPQSQGDHPEHINKPNNIHTGKH